MNDNVLTDGTHDFLQASSVSTLTTSFVFHHERAAATR